MKQAISIFIISTVVLTMVAFGIFVFSSINGSDSKVNRTIWPDFIIPSAESKVYDGFITEKIFQQNANYDDMRTPLYLTQHKFLLENIAKLEINYHQKTYSLNDICFKPHSAIFQEFAYDEGIPHHFQRLLLEIQRLSPCLLVTPLNCFYDIHGIHSEMSSWISNTDFLNRRLRNSFIEAQGEKENRPYVKSDYAPELITKWSEIMFQLKSKESTRFSKKDLHDRVKLWITSIEPHQKDCLNPIHVCNETMNAEKYLNMCTEIQQFQSLTIKKYQFEDEDRKLISQLDCVDDQDKFIEWMQEKELKEIMRTLSSGFETSAYRKKLNQKCDGIYRDMNSSGINFFDGLNSFSNESNPFDSMKLEIALLTPEILLSKLIHADYVNGFESIWTIQRAEELVYEFRMALRGEIVDFNKRRSSETFEITTDILPSITEEMNTSSAFPNSVILFFVGCRGILVLLFLAVVWLGNRVRSILMFFIRDCITLFLFIFLCQTNGVIRLDFNTLSYGLFITVVNLFLTTRVSFCAHRLQRCIQRSNEYPINSNYSSLGTVPVDSFKPSSDRRQTHYVTARYTKYQTAQNAYSTQPFENLSKFGYFFSLLFVPIVVAYWYFVDRNCHKILVVVLPSIFIAGIEEGWEKRKLCKERELIQNHPKGNENEEGNCITQEDTDKIFAGCRIGDRDVETNYVSSNSNIPKESSKALFKLSNSTYDVNEFMKYPNQLIRELRFYAIGGYFYVIKLRKLDWLGWVIPLLLIFIASGSLFIPIQRESLQIDASQNDLFIDFSIYNASSNWNSIMNDLKRLDADFDSIESLQTISNWFETFQSFNQKNLPVSSVAHYLKWIQEEPISWAVTTQRMESSHKSLPNPFKFRFRYIFKNLNEESIKETVKKIDEILLKYSGYLVPKASGVLYEHYHRIDVVWNSFAINELLTSLILFFFISLIHIIFSITPNPLLTLLFSIFVIGTRLEIAAIFSLFSIEYHQFYSSFAVLAGFLAAWTPYCDLARFRRRVLYRAQIERYAPEDKQGKRRIRLPFIAAADVVQFFGTLLAVSTSVVVFSSIIPEFRKFVLPTVILIGIQLLALMNSIAIMLSAKQIFELEVRQFMHHELRGENTTSNISDLTQKKPFLDKSVPAEMDQSIIQPVPKEPLFWSPPPKKQPDEKEESESGKSSERDGKDNEPETSHSRHSNVSKLMKSVDGTEQSKQQFLQSFYPFNLQGEGVFSDPVHFLSCGLPIDSGYTVPPGQANEMEHLEFDYEADEDELLNSGDNLDDALKRALKRRRGKDDTDDSNEPGPSSRIRPGTFYTSNNPMMSSQPIPESSQTGNTQALEFVQEMVASGSHPTPRGTSLINIPLFDTLRLPVRNLTPPPFDPNWVAPPGTPPIPTYADALAFHQSRISQDNKDEEIPNTEPNPNPDA